MVLPLIMRWSLPAIAAVVVLAQAKPEVLSGHTAYTASATALATDASRGAEPSASSLGATVRLAKSSDGLFYVSALVNKHPVRFLVDTGANLVVLTPEDAKEVGLVARDDGTTDNIDTAAGPSEIRRVTLENVDVAGYQVRNIDAAVMGSGLKVSLLGQNMLAKLGPITFLGDAVEFKAGTHIQ
jgi:aspartyl protease family protein